MTLLGSHSTRGAELGPAADPLPLAMTLPGGRWGGSLSQAVLVRTTQGPERGSILRVFRDHLRAGPHSWLSPQASPEEADPGPGHVGIHQSGGLGAWGVTSLLHPPCVVSWQDDLSRGKSWPRELGEERDLLLIECLLYARPEKTLERDVL